LIQAESIGTILIIAVAIVSTVLFWDSFSSESLARYDVEVYGGAIGISLAITLLAGVALLTYAKIRSRILQ
jgi:hypothetical protein